MNPRQRRQCCVMGQCLVFGSMEYYNERVANNYRSASAQIVDQCTKMMENLTEQYLNNKLGQEVPPTFGGDPNKKPLLITASNAENPFSSIEQTQAKSKHCFSFDGTEGKFKVPASSKKMNESQDLQQSLKKLQLQEKEGKSEEEEELDFENQEYLKGKTVCELIQESQQKMENKKLTSKGAIQERSFSSEDSYPLTEYSSNESSNRNDYSEYMIMEEFENIKPCQSFKTATMLSSLSSQSLGGYKAKKIMFSPKKSKSQELRLYIRDKKIPRWAQNMDKVKEMVNEQKKDPNMKPQLIYGVCMVEKLDSNVIFNQDKLYERGSSAKWVRNIQYQFQ